MRSSACPIIACESSERTWLRTSAVSDCVRRGLRRYGRFNGPRSLHQESLRVSRRRQRSDVSRAPQPERPVSVPIRGPLPGVGRARTRPEHLGRRPAAGGTEQPGEARAARSVVSRRVKWLRDTLEAESAAAGFFEPSGLTLRPKIVYAASDNWKVIVGAEVFRGESSSLFGLLRQNSAAYFEARWSF